MSVTIEHVWHTGLFSCMSRRKARMYQYTRDLIYDLSAKLLVPTVSNYLGSPHVNYSLALIWKSFVG